MVKNTSMLKKLLGYVDAFFVGLSDALGTNTCIALFILIAFVPLHYQLPHTLMEWQTWLSTICIQLVCLAVIQKGGKVTEKRIMELLIANHDLAMKEQIALKAEIKELRAMHKELDSTVKETVTA